MSKGSRKEQICLAASGESAAGQGALADPSAETSLPGAAVTHLWLWVSASCRAPACPAASCQQLEWHEGFAGQARKASGLPLLAGCACCWENMALLGGAGPLGGALLAAPCSCAAPPEIPGQRQGHAGCPPSLSHTVHLICRLQGAKKLCPQCNTITSPGDLRRIYL